MERQIKFPYYSPNLKLVDLFKALMVPRKEAEEKIKRYFAAITGKKYIILTNSCRTALFMTYLSLEKKGKVITTPLTCNSALLPIYASGNEPNFIDISVSDLNINPEDITVKLINSEAIAIQIVHHGGIPCKMDSLLKLAKTKNLAVVEDCAQSLGTKFNEKNTGSFGDFSCFSLVKNSYGIGGGVLATNSKHYYQKLNAINKGFKRSHWGLTIYRAIRNVIETHRINWLSRFLYILSNLLKTNGEDPDSIKSQLSKISEIEIKIAAFQIDRYSELHYKRNLIGQKYYNILNSKSILINNNYDPSLVSFTKFFLYNCSLKSKEVIFFFKNHGIETMHLEDKKGSPIQKGLISKKEAQKLGLENYCNVIDHVISLPLSEQMTVSQITFICSLIQKLVQ